MNGLYGSLIVGLGGAIGSMARYGAGLAMPRPSDLSFPWSTFAVNMIGSFAIGCVMAALVSLQDVPRGLMLFLVVGILGGFTTFSAFSLETLRLIELRALGPAAVYVILSVTLGVVAAGIGVFGTQAVLR